MVLDPHKIHEARLAADMSQADLAYRLRDLGVAATERSIRRWETGENEPRANVLPAIAQATGKPVDYFLAESVAPFPGERDD